MKNRRDGKRVKIGGLSQCLIDIKPDRCDSDVYINEKVDVTKLVEYIEKKKKNNEKITYFHAFVTAIGKSFYNRPKLNRFVTNRHLYEHNDIVVSFVAKESFDDKAQELMIMVPIEKNSNIYSIAEYIKNKLEGIRNKKVKKEGANSVIDTIGKLPNIVRVPLMGLLKWMDRKDLLPASFMKDNIYYSSIIISNLGSIKCGAIYHNITNFGTCSGLITMGEIKKEGSKYFCEFGINLDERIADGYYFAKSLKLIQYILNNPELLEEAASKKVEMKEIR